MPQVEISSGKMQAQRQKGVGAKFITNVKE